MSLFMIGLLIGTFSGALIQSFFKGSDCDDCQDRANARLADSLRARGEIPEEEILDGNE